MDSYNILDSISTSVIITNKFMEIVHINSSGENFLQNSKKNLKNVKINEIFAKKNNIIISQVYDAIALNQASVSRDIEVSLKTKSKYKLDCNVQAISINNEKHVLLEINLIERQKKIATNASYIDRNNTTQLITRSFAHEIKNPLGGIRGAAQLLALEIDSKYKEYVDIIIKEVDRLKNYIDKMSGPNKEPSFENINIHEIIDRVIKVLGTNELKKNNILLNYDPSIPDVKVDKDMIIQVLMNLIKNSQEAIIKDGLIEIKTRIDRNFTINSIKYKLVAVISVIDNGVGINEEMKNKLFLPLVTDKSNGTGLGLSISQRLVSINNGIITFDEEKGKTVFKIILPIEKENND